jgi:glutaminyl-peptide cyclotransferase
VGRTGSGGIAVAIVAALAVLQGCGEPNHPGADAAAGPTVYGYRVVHVYPHDPRAFTQGLIYRDGDLFESTGLNGRSSLRRVKLATGEVIRQVAVDSQYFAEGLTDWDGQLLQLTLSSGMAFSYDLATFAVKDTFPYPGAGWGLTHDGTRLIMSDGSSSLRFLDPVTFTETGRLPVTLGGSPIDNLNELELVDGEIYANVWPTNWIARISLKSGQVTGWIDLEGLLGQGPSDSVDVLNGIAYDARKHRLFVTGKLWPSLFEIELVRQRRT